MKTIITVVVILVVLLVLVLVVLAAIRNQRRARLRQRFGPEYDLAVRRGKDRRAVEQRLAALAERRDTLEIHDVARQEHERFTSRWSDLQSRFVDDPGQAVADADGLVNAVLRSRGYPVESFDDRVALVATDHQDVVEQYRSAHDTYAEHLHSGSTGTEQLRQAFLAYRQVFGRLNQPVQAAPAKQGTEEGAGEATKHVPEKGLEKGPEKGPDKGPLKGPLKGEEPAAVRLEPQQPQADPRPRA